MVTLSGISFFLPIFAFLLVFIVVYALLVKSKILGESPAVALFVSFLMAAFFVVQASLVEFIQFASAGFSVLVIVVFFLLLVVAFAPGEKALWFLEGKNWFGWVLLGAVIAVFIWVSSYVFNWVINWESIEGWASSNWFGFVLLLVIAGIVSFILTKKVKG